MIQAVILAGGLGTRLRAVLGDLPKPMAPILGKPFLEYQLLALRRYSVDKIVICLSYRAEMISEYFGDGSRLGLRIRYSVEPTPLGTGGAIKYAEPLLDRVFLVLNGDTFVDFEYGQLLQYHRQKAALATIAVTAPDDRIARGNVIINPEGQVTCFREEGVEGNATQQTWCNAGMYILERPVLSRIPGGRPVSLEKESFPLLLEGREPIYALVVSGYFVDIGTPASFSRFEQDLREGRAHVD